MIATYTKAGTTWTQQIPGQIGFTGAEGNEARANAELGQECMCGLQTVATEAEEAAPDLDLNSCYSQNCNVTA